MKVLLIQFLLFFSTAFGQTLEPLNHIKQNSSIDVRGNNNIIRVIQGGKTILYNLNDEDHYQKFLSYLKTLPGFMQKIEKILKSNERTLSLISKAIESGVFNPQEFTKTIDRYIRENERLKIENENLKKQSTDMDFKIALEEASKKLDVYDNAGYQQILESFITENDKKISKAKHESANAVYLQAENSFYNFHGEKALEQINKALLYDESNIDYLSLKARILMFLSRSSESLIIYEKIIPSVKNDTIKSVYYNDLGLAYTEKGDLNKALDSYHNALIINKEIFGDDEVNAAAFYDNIGAVYEKKYDYDTALRYFKKALSIQIKLLGNIHEHVADSYNNIGTVFCEKGDYDKALEYLDKALAIKLQLFGEEHPNTAITYNNIGFAYLHKDDIKNAQRCYYKALIISEKIFGYNHSNTAAAYNSMGTLYDWKRACDSALDCYGKALAIYERVLGIEHSKTAQVYCNLGLTLSHMGHLDKALFYYFKALEIQKKELGTNDAVTANTYNNIGSAYKKKSNYYKALEYYDTALAINQNVLGNDHPYTAACYQDIAVILILKEEKEKGISYLEKTNYSVSKIIRIFNNEGMNFSAENKYAECINLLLFAIEFLKKNDSASTSVSSIILYYNLARVYCINGNKNKSMPLFEKALKMAKNIKEGAKYIQAITKNYENCKN